ncbi:DUF2207 domain-containing protein [Streptomyces sp. NBC_01361]|uniref:DUF2207 domain-containing protein n=1 Tax=Streptomyces sp. NBC_01361 TaxID=2903838 RepID=UPI002E314142|nr:DUF2207 domain-containing protein [Streptomyces sp. NBC_01361]
MLALGGVMWFVGAVATTERVTRMWVGAVVAKDGSARITEVIDYDFGHPLEGRHGIYRDIPGLTYDDSESDVSATLDGGPVPYELTYGETTERSIRVGDPDRTITGLHRYRIQYTLHNVAPRRRLAWDAVGTGWQIDLRNVEIHVATPYDLDGTRCVQGKRGSKLSCTAAEPEDGHLVARFGKIKAGRGVTLYASSAAARDAAGQAAAQPVAPADAKPDGETLTNPLWTGLAVAGTALLCGLLTVGALRVLGRDRLPADAATAEALDAPTPPEELTPAQGGILLAERVEPQHKVAWLLDTAIRRHITITGAGQHPTLRRTAGLAGVPDANTAAVLDDMFAGRKEFVLGLYDPLFRSAWQTLDARLTSWQRTSGLWDPAGERRERRAFFLGLGATLLGVVVACVGSALTAQANAAGRLTAVGGGAVMGIGIALLSHAWELRSRTAHGTALRFQVESFRRQLAESPAHLANETNDTKDQLELLTAWAVALDEAERWEQAVTASTTTPATSTVHRSTALARFGPALAVGLIAAAATSSTAPSSSGSGDSGGGSSSGGVGGGAGGGGGGSW